MLSFNKIFKILIKLSYQKPFQLTHLTQNNNFYINITKFLIFYVYLYLFLTSFDLEVFLDIIRINFLNLWIILDNFLYFKIYLPTILNISWNFYNTSYYAPITNFRKTILGLFFNFLENFFFKNNYDNKIYPPIIYFLKIINTQQFSIFREFRFIIILFLFLFIIFLLFYSFFKILHFFFIIVIILFFLFFIYSTLMFFDEPVKILNYFEFQISESFKNRNLYIDSNYFLTSNSLYGIEKFSDISVPWLVDYEDLGWGSDFDIQDQVDQIAERERKYITDEMNLNYSPHIEYKNNVPGSLNSRLLKFKQRIFVYFDTIQKYSVRVSKLFKILKSETKFNIESNFTNNFEIIKNFFRPDSVAFYTSLGTLHENTDRFNLIKMVNSREDIKNLLPRFEITNNFVLPKKNNISNNSFRKVGYHQDRKQSVFRKLTDNLNSVESNNQLHSRMPDFSKESNYIFERQLQTERSFEFDFKEFLKKRLFNRYNYYYFNYNLPNLKMIKPQSKHFIKTIKPPIDKILDSYNTDSYNVGFKKFKNFGNNITDLYLENLLKYWNNKNLSHKNIEPRDMEFVYFKNTGRFVNGFFNKIDTLNEVLHTLLKNNSLGLGTFTYQDYDNSQWLSSWGTSELFLDKLITERMDSVMLNWWSLKDYRIFYNSLRNYSDTYFKDVNFEEKKAIMICLALFSINIWFDFENNNIFPNINDIFRISLAEFLCNPPYITDMLYNKIKDTKYYFFKDSNSSVYSKKFGRNFKKYKLFLNYEKSFKTLVLNNFKISFLNNISKKYKQNLFFFYRYGNIKLKPNIKYTNFLFLRYNFELLRKLKTNKYFIYKLTGKFLFIFEKNELLKQDSTWCFNNYFTFKISNLPKINIKKNQLLTTAYKYQLESVEIKNIFIKIIKYFFIFNKIWYYYNTSFIHKITEIFKNFEFFKNYDLIFINLNYFCKVKLFIRYFKCFVFIFLNNCLYKINNNIYIIFFLYEKQLQIFIINFLFFFKNNVNFSIFYLHLNIIMLNIYNFFFFLSININLCWFYIFLYKIFYIILSYLFILIKIFVLLFFIYMDSFTNFFFFLNFFF